MNEDMKRIAFRSVGNAIEVVDRNHELDVVTRRKIMNVAFALADLKDVAGGTVFYVSCSLKRNGDIYMEIDGGVECETDE